MGERNIGTNNAEEIGVNKAKLEPESELKIHKNESLLGGKDEETGAQKLFTEAYKWVSENKTTVAITAAALAVAGGAGLLRRATTSSVDNGLVDLAITNVEKNATTPGKLRELVRDNGSIDVAYLNELKNAAASGKLGELELHEPERSVWSAWFEREPRNLLAGREHEVIDHELTHGYVPGQHSPGLWYEPDLNFELGQEFVNSDGSLKILSFMGRDPETAMVFRAAEGIKKAAGDNDWGAAVIKAFEKHSPRDLPWVKDGLRQIGMLKE